MPNQSRVTVPVAHRSADALIREACLKTGWRVPAFVLLGSHYHLLLETAEVNLMAGMKWLQGAFTQRYNGRHRCFGYLFQGGYAAYHF